VALVLRDGKVVYQHAAGSSDLATHRAMRPTTLFRIVSQTKALTSVVILSLLEEGKLSVSDPVSRYIPAFAHTTVATRSDTGRVIKPASRQINQLPNRTDIAGKFQTLVYQALVERHR